MSLDSKPVKTEGRKKDKDRVLQAMWPEAPLGIMFYPRVIRRQEGLMADDSIYIFQQVFWWLEN